MNVEATVASLEALVGRIARGVQTALSKTTAVVAREARTSRTFKDRTGYLRGSIEHIVRGPYAQFVRAGGPNARYALFVEDGTKPHEIVPRRRTWLRFMQGGRVRFAKRVHHPGTKPTKFMRNASNVGETAAEGFFDTELKEAIR